MKGKPGASLDESRGEVSLLCDGLPFLALCRSQAVALRDAITAALDGDPDKTPPLGTRAAPVTTITKRSAVSTAWRRYRGDLRHAASCPGAASETTLEARIANRACSCGLREFVLALEVS